MTRRHAPVIAVVIAMLALQGCLLDRLYQSQRDLCDHAIRLEYSGDVALVFDRPVLLPGDIVKIAGVPPKNVSTEAPDRLTYEYVAIRKPTEANVRHSIPVLFEFERASPEFKLKRARSSLHLKEIFSAELLQQALASGCQARLSGTELIVDLAALDLTRLPGRDTVEQILGDPSKINGRTMIYQYALDASANALIEITYDQKLDRMLVARVQYFRYVLQADFTKQHATGKLKDWRSAFALSYWLTVSP